MDPIVESVAQQLIEAGKSGVPCAPIRNTIGVEDIDLAYDIQTFIANKKIYEGQRIVGRKIGLTSQAVQNQLGVGQPDYGALFNEMEILNGNTVPFSDLMQPKIETEIAFVVGENLDAEFLTLTDLIRAIDYALVSIEIAGSRVANWDIKITDTVADNASASHFVLGHRPVSLSDLDLVNCKMSMKRNGEIVSQGQGRDCLGSPLNACLWLAKTMSKLEQPLKKGDIILSGALGPMSEVAPGDEFEATIEGLGEVYVSIGQ